MGFEAGQGTLKIKNENIDIPRTYCDKIKKKLKIQCILMYRGA